MALFIIRYGELGLKSEAVRRRFEKVLKTNVVNMFIGMEKECRIELDRGRVFLWSDEAETTAEILRRTFGVVSFSQAVECPSDKDEILRMAAEISKPLFRKGMSFRVKARRIGQHDYTSMELAKDAGSAIWIANEHLEPCVNLSDPDLTIHIEVRQKRAFIFTDVIPGPGGMPLGTQGRVLGIMNDEKAMTACWLMMKRGCATDVSTDDAGLAETLKRWNPNINVEDPVSLEEAEDLAKSIKAEGIVLGWDLADFEDNKEKLTKLSLPVFFPIIGMNPSEVTELVRHIGF